jgi:hypothetical protein
MKRIYNNGIHTDKTQGKGSRRRHGNVQITDEKWNSIFKKGAGKRPVKKDAE